MQKDDGPDLPEAPGARDSGPGGFWEGGGNGRARGT